jgi:transporter family protein
VDYRILSILALVLWGAWGYMSKVLTRSGPTGVLAFWASLAGVLPIAAFTAATGTLRWHRLAPAGIVAGLLAGIATTCFYFALRRGPASVVVPLTGMYIIIPALLGYVFLKEPLTLKHALGLGCAVLAVVLLAA